MLLNRQYWLRVNTAYTADFADVARAYCSWCETFHSEHSDEQAAYWLSRLYAQALVLPKGISKNSAEIAEIPPDKLALATTNLASFSGRYYRVIFNPDYRLADAPVMGDLGDDLLDTYKDIREGLIRFDRGEIEGAARLWSFLHRAHWGRHAVDAISALHGLTISNELP